MAGRTLINLLMINFLFYKTEYIDNFERLLQVVDLFLVEIQSLLLFSLSGKSKNLKHSCQYFQKSFTKKAQRQLQNTNSNVYEQG